MLDIALKEWAIVCELLVSGELALLLRKGGIAETGGAGVFELEHKRFGLFPAWEHQKSEMLKEAYRTRPVLEETEPARIPLPGVGEAIRIWQVPSREAMDALDDLHCWSQAQIDMRFDYKPDRPLYLMAVRAWRLHEPKVIEQHAAYRGCRSWVPLRDGDDVADGPDQLTPAMDDDAFAAVVRRVDAVM